MGRIGDDRPGRPPAGGWPDFADFYRASYERLVRQLVAVTGRRQDAEDVVQEAFARAAQRWEQLSRYDKPEAWVRQVAMRLVIDELRRVRRALAALVRHGPPAPAPGPSETLPAVVDALRLVPLRYRQVLVLHHLADLPVDEVAAELRLPVGTVTARLSRGRALLRAALGPDHAEVLGG